MSWVSVWLAAGLLHADEPPSPEHSVPWHDHYATARDQAKQRGTLLLVQFVAPQQQQSAAEWRRSLASSAELRSALASLVCVAVSTADTVTVEGQEVVLLEHPAFREMQRRPGLAIVDFREPQSITYHQVVSVLPAAEGTLADAVARRVYPSIDDVQVLLDLPAGTLTQRTLIYAVRTHPDQPQSTAGEWHPVLVSESAAHARYQADIGVQGHHAWETRFHRINAQLPGESVAQEVCAESWSGQGLLSAARECVRSWRQSSGHWGAVSARQAFFGYDMQRGTNGVWYATGIFGRRR